MNKKAYLAGLGVVALLGACSDDGVQPDSYIPSDAGNDTIEDTIKDDAVKHDTGKYVPLEKSLPNDWSGTIKPEVTDPKKPTEGHVIKPGDSVDISALIPEVTDSEGTKKGDVEWGFKIVNAKQGIDYSIYSGKLQSTKTGVDRKKEIKWDTSQKIPPNAGNVPDAGKFTIEYTVANALNNALKKTKTMTVTLADGPTIDQCVRTNTDTGALLRIDCYGSDKIGPQFPSWSIVSSNLSGTVVDSLLGLVNTSSGLTKTGSYTIKVRLTRKGDSTKYAEKDIKFNVDEVSNTLIINDDKTELFKTGANTEMANYVFTACNGGACTTPAYQKDVVQTSIEANCKDTTAQYVPALIKAMHDVVNATSTQAQLVNMQEDFKNRTKTADYTSKVAKWINNLHSKGSSVCSAYPNLLIQNKTN